MWTETIARVAERRANATTRAGGAQDPPPLFAPVDDRAVRDAEHELGFALPVFLSALYTSVGNGGYGPGYGLVGLRAGYASDNLSVVEWYQSVRAPDSTGTVLWPRAVLPICDWGCAIYSCVDCSTPNGRVLAYHSGEITWDASRERVLAVDMAFAPTHEELAAFFHDWAHGVDIWALMFEDDPTKQPVVAINPFTRAPMPLAPIQRLRRSK